MTIQYTVTETAILKVLADGGPHKRRELLDCLADDMATPQALTAHMHRIRKKLPANRTILCELRNGINYRMVELISWE